MQYFHENKRQLIAGCDEVGRGCLAGPVVAAAVILNPKQLNTQIADSKSKSKKSLLELSNWIKSHALSYAISFINPSEIDRINILNASILGMHASLSKLTLQPDHILVDGHIFKPFEDIPHTCVIKGDSKYFSIAAASILAKVARDHFMENLHILYPYYDWHKNVGYPTKHHKLQIESKGFTPFHRKTFKGVVDFGQLQLFNS